MRVFFRKRSASRPRASGAVSTSGPVASIVARDFDELVVQTEDQKRRRPLADEVRDVLGLAVSRELKPERHAIDPTDAHSQKSDGSCDVADSSLRATGPSLGGTFSTKLRSRSADVLDTVLTRVSMK